MHFNLGGINMSPQQCGIIRKRSQQTILGLPLVDIAIGPDPEKNEVRGHARGIIAIGDIATGWLAFGGVAYGGLASGGIAVGIVSFGGLSIGLAALGGLAIGGIAVGGGAIGFAAIGGGAIGYYALGGGALGKYVIMATERSQEAVDFFKHWLPFLQLK